jgi:hypothetical protein
MTKQVYQPMKTGLMSIYLTVSMFLKHKRTTNWSSPKNM